MSISGSVIVGGCVGLFNFFMNWASRKKFRMGGKGSYWKPSGHDAQRKILRRGSLAISPRNWMQTLPVFLPGILMSLIFLGLYWIALRDLVNGIAGIVGILAGMSLGGLLSYPFGFGRNMRKYLREVAQAGAEMLAKLDDTELAGRLFAAATQQKDSNLRLAAVTGFRELGEIQHVDKLEVLCSDPDPEVQADAVAAVLNLRRRLIQKPMSVLQLRPLFNDHWTLQRKVQQASTGSSIERFQDLYEKNEQRFEAILDSQLPLLRAFPHLYCQQCYAFAERQTAWDWEWVRCKSCQDAVNLVAGVERVTGQIGGRTAWNLSEGHLKVQLWDAAARSARSGRISTLEIIGGQNIDYDWAVSAVVEKLHNENPDYGKAIRVVLVGQPVLAANTVKLLRDLDPTFVG